MFKFAYAPRFLADNILFPDLQSGNKVKAKVEKFKFNPKFFLKKNKKTPLYFSKNFIKNINFTRKKFFLNISKNFITKIRLLFSFFKFLKIFLNKKILKFKFLGKSKILNFFDKTVIKKLKVYKNFKEVKKFFFFLNFKKKLKKKIKKFFFNFFLLYNYSNFFSSFYISKNKNKKLLCFSVKTVSLELLIKLLKKLNFDNIYKKFLRYFLLIHFNKFLINKSYNRIFFLYIKLKKFLIHY